MGHSQTEDDSTGSFDTRLWVNSTDRDWVNQHKQGSETQADVINHLTSLHDALDELGVDVPRNPTPEELREALDTPRRDSETEAVDADALAEAVADRLYVPDTEDFKDAAERGTENALENIR